jgi:putative heme-binding domain-containing protein
MWMLLVLFLQASPHASADDVERGGKAYRIHCARCHGLSGEGGRGANLADGDFYRGDTDADLFRNVDDGIAGTGMPGTWLAPVRIWQIVAFVRTLNQASEPASVPGNASRGESLFREDGACLQCHRVGREGGFAGPDLSTIASRRSVGHLRASILKPDEDVSQAYWTATVTTSNGGDTTAGFIRSDDRHHLLLLDLDGHLRSFRKDELSSVEVDRQSTMQSYDGFFDTDELEDLVAYLATLRKERSR